MEVDDYREEYVRRRVGLLKTRGECVEDKRRLGGTKVNRRGRKKTVEDDENMSVTKFREFLERQETCPGVGSR